MSTGLVSSIYQLKASADPNFHDCYWMIIVNQNPLFLFLTFAWRMRRCCHDRPPPNRSRVCLHFSQSMPWISLSRGQFLPNLSLLYEIVFQIYCRVEGSHLVRFLSHCHIHVLSTGRLFYRNRRKFEQNQIRWTSERSWPSLLKLASIGVSRPTASSAVKRPSRVSPLYELSDL